LSRSLDLTAAARADIAQILQTSAADFGEGARSRYGALVATALKDLLDDPERPESLARPELQSGVRSYHLRHSRRRAFETKREHIKFDPGRRRRHSSAQGL
jgi:toxin ParE1/3/4